MGQGKRAWIYCAIDAPEDRNGALKSQFKQLIDYGEQMGFELVGSSSDVGTTPLWNRNGFRHFIEAVQKEQVDVLLIVNRGRLSRSSMQLARFQIFQENYDVDAYSPLESVHHYRKIGNKIMADETRAVREKIDMILMDVVKEWDGYEI